MCVPNGDVSILVAKSHDCLGDLSNRTKEVNHDRHLEDAWGQA